MLASKEKTFEVFDLEQNTYIDNSISYLISYPHMIGFFEKKETIEPSDVVCGAHMVYGWMPTIIDLYIDGEDLTLEKAAGILTKVKQQGSLNDSELTYLSRLVNNSLVGTSKLLHFISPLKFAIWDSKVYSFFFNKRPYHHNVNKVSNYRSYMAEMVSIQDDERFPNFHLSINNKIGYEVSPLRAIELIMYLNAPSF